MNVLVIYTHPTKNSLNGSMLENALAGLKNNKAVQSIEVLDLYEEKFNPVLIFNENKRRRDQYKDPEFAKYRQQLEWADKVVFIYPIWWGRPPAMLLGYFDQVMATNFAYKRLNNYQMEGLLKNKSAVCVSTMQGPSFYLKLLMNNVHKVLMKRVVLSFVGIKKVKFFEFGDMESKKGKQEKKLSEIRRYFQTITA